MDAKETKVVVAPNVTLDMELTTAHIADIAVAAEEERLLAEEVALDKQLKTLREKSNRLQKAAAEVIRSMAVKEGKAFEKLVKKPLETMGYKKLVFSHQAHLNSLGRVHIHVVVAGELCALGKDFTRKKPAACTVLERRCETTDDAIKSAQEKLLSVKRQLGNVDRIARRAKAQIAAYALKGTEKGRGILAAMNSGKKLLTDGGGK